MPVPALRGSVVVVDAFSSGAYLPLRLRQRGFRVIHVRSAPELADFYQSSHLGGAHVELTFNGDMRLLLDEVARCRPIAVMPGTETGVRLADELCHRLGLPGNEHETSDARRNKFHMIEALASAGIRCARHLLTSHTSEAVGWAGRVGYPVVVKPPESAGSDNVFFCFTDEEVVHAVRGIVGSDNMLGLENREAVVEEMLVGEEFLFNTISRNGEHLVTDFGYSNRIALPSGSVVYDSIDILPFDHPAFASLRDYFFRALDAVGIRSGAAHGELKMTADGPVLIEVGARLPGIGFPQLVAHCTDTSPVDALIDAHVDGTAFERRLRSGVTQRHLAKVVFLLSGWTGEIRGDLSAHPFSQLTSFHDLKWNVPPRTPLPRTRDLFSSPGFVRLVHDDPGVLAQDHCAVRRLEPVFYSQLLGRKKEAATTVRLGDVARIV